MFIYFKDHEQRSLINLDKVEQIYVKDNSIFLDMPESSDLLKFVFDSEEEAATTFERITMITSARGI